MDSSARGTGHHTGFRTMCGRQIRVSRLVLGGGSRPAQRVSLDIGGSSGDSTGTWAGLTAAEARRLALALLIQADACDAARLHR